MNFSRNSSLLEFKCFISSSHELLFLLPFYVVINLLLLYLCAKTNEQTGGLVSSFCAFLGIFHFFLAPKICMRLQRNETVVWIFSTQKYFLRNMTFLRNFVANLFFDIYSFICWESVYQTFLINHFERFFSCLDFSEI